MNFQNATGAHHPLLPQDRRAQTALDPRLQRVPGMEGYTQLQNRRLLTEPQFHPLRETLSQLDDEQIQKIHVNGSINKLRGYQIHATSQALQHPTFLNCFRKNRPFKLWNALSYLKETEVQAWLQRVFHNPETALKPNAFRAPTAINSRLRQVPEMAENAQPYPPKLLNQTRLAPPRRTLSELSNLIPQAAEDQPTSSRKRKRPQQESRLGNERPNNRQKIDTALGRHEIEVIETSAPATSAQIPSLSNPFEEDHTWPYFDLEGYDWSVNQPGSPIRLDEFLIAYPQGILTDIRPTDRPPERSPQNLQPEERRRQ